MRKILVGVFIIVTACFQPSNNRPITIPQSSQKTIDSLQTVLHKTSLVVDSLTSKLKQQRILIRFTAEKCHKYAAIVKKNPSQSIFIVGWIDRAFQWVDE